MRPIISDPDDVAPTALMGRPPLLELDGLSWGPRGQKAVLRDVSLALRHGRVLGIVGPNGAGKSTLLRLIYRYFRPTAGRILFEGRDLWQMEPRAAARQIAAVLQEQPSDFALTLRQIVALGRAPHPRGANDMQKVAHALEQLDLTALAERRLNGLSGGERQRAMVARALVQEPKLLVLDEPTNHLDIRHQLEILTLIRGLGPGVVVSLHDLNLAAKFCDDILILSRGNVMGQGPARDMLHPPHLTPVFDVAVRAERLEPSGGNQLTFHLVNEGTSA
ncbi:MAG: ABC transporter ATP-binding protein [Pseudorhodobacter sp.]